MRGAARRGLVARRLVSELTAPGSLTGDTGRVPRYRVDCDDWRRGGGRPSNRASRSAGGDACGCTWRPSTCTRHPPRGWASCRCCSGTRTFPGASSRHPPGWGASGARRRPDSKARKRGAQARVHHEHFSHAGAAARRFDPFSHCFIVGIFPAANAFTPCPLCVARPLQVRRGGAKTPTRRRITRT